MYACTYGRTAHLLSQVVRTLDCWLLLLAASILIGAGAMLTTNAAQVAVPKGASPPPQVSKTSVDTCRMRE